MSKAFLIAVSMVGAACLNPVHGQELDKFSMHAGGGISTPLNPTGAYTGVSGNFVFGAGYKINRNNSILGEFMWSGLPSSVFVFHPVSLPRSDIALYSLTVNYRHDFQMGKSPFGLYLIGGGGWYNRYAKLEKDYVVPPFVPCYPIYGWWGYGCDPYGYVYTETVASKGVSAGGFNGGLGFSIRLGDSNLRFFTEARYHYAFSERIPTTLIPVTMGLRFN